MSKPLPNCKTYVEGKGWVYNFELNREEPKEKTNEEMIEDIFQIALRAKVKTINSQPSNSWQQPTRDQAYIRELEINHK